MLLMIRMKHSGLVGICIDQGISVTSQCCTGQIKSLYWDTDPSKQAEETSDDEQDDDEAQGDQDHDSFQDEKKKKKKNNAKKSKPKPKINLRAEYEMETPLSAAVTVSDLDVVKRLLKDGANPLRCDDIAIRAGVTTLVTKEEESKFTLPFSALFCSNVVVV